MSLDDELRIDATALLPVGPAKEDPCMHDPGTPFHLRGDDFLQQLQLMRTEISSAMLAISGNSLQALEESLWRQEILCASLHRLLPTLENTHADPATLHRIQSASAALLAVNRSYAALVQQSRASAETLYTLCRTYSDATAAGHLRSPAKCSLEA